MELFGSIKENFSFEKLSELIKLCKKEDETTFNNVKNYIHAFFIKTLDPHGVIIYRHSRKTIEFMKLSDAKEIISKSRTLYFPKSKKSFQHWFFNEDNTYYTQIMNRSKPLIYREVETNYVNLFDGYAHPIIKEDPTPEMQDKINKLWNHVFVSWCSRDKEQFKYIKNWISHMCVRKMTSMLFLNGDEGTGKSFFTDFLMGNVLGDNICHVTTDYNIIVEGSNNLGLQGKVLLVLEEIPDVNNAKWKATLNSLKHFTTGKKIVMSDKYIKKVSVENVISLIILTNNDALTSGRRYMICDLSSEMKENIKYFDEMNEIANDKEVGKYFYNDCIKHYEQTKKWFEYPVPATKGKKDIAVEHLSVLKSFIKESYVLAGETLDKPFAEFYKEYDLYCTEKKKTPVSNIRVSKELRTFLKPIRTERKTDNKLFIIADTEELKNFYIKNHWIHETDDFKDPNMILTEDQALGMDDLDIANKIALPKWIQEELEYKSKKQERQDKINAQLDELEKKKPKSTIDNIYNLMK